MLRINSLVLRILVCSLAICSSPGIAASLNKQLSSAIEFNDSAFIIRQLEAGLKIDHRIKSETLLMMAARKGRYAIVKLLVGKGADVNAKSSKGHNAMSYSSRYGHLPIVQYLLNHGAEVNITNKNKWTPLLKAARGGHLAVVDYLLAHDADIKSRNSAGLDALALARRYGHKKVVRYLRKHRRAYK